MRRFIRCVIVIHRYVRLYVEIIQELSTNETVHKNCNINTMVCPPVCGDNPGALADSLSTNEAVHKICNSNITVCPPVCGDNP